MTPAARVIVTEVSERTQVSLAEICSHDHSARVVAARYEVFRRLYALKQGKYVHSAYSMTGIGRWFGFDPSTIAHAIHRQGNRKKTREKEKTK